MTTTFHATMYPAGHARFFGWLVALGLTALATPIVLVVQKVDAHPVVFAGAAALGAALIAFAIWRKRSGAHDVTLADGTLEVDGPSIRLTLRDVSARALLGEIVPPYKPGLRIPVHVLVVEQHDVPVLALEEAMPLGWREPGWQPVHTLDYGGAPVLVKSGAPINLDRLRDALA